MRTFRTTVRLCLISVSVAWCSASAVNAQETLQFNRDIRSILSSNCFECHGFDAKHREGNLRLDTAEGAFAVHDGVAAIRPGDPDSSELWKRITSSDPDVMMPPPASKKSLTDEQKSTLRTWIQQGAAYQKHWAFEPPATAASPAIRDSWIRTPVDAFILERLQKDQLVPQREADRETLIRRVAFVLTGLPPKVSEVDEFLGDKSPDAYEKMVQRYLDSPRYGEEQARYWLDVARYADTHGLHLDNEREMWAYRDWVIRAYNTNLPFDKFTTWQLAGDLLPDATLDQKVATGFSRCNVTTSEGGAINDEFLYRYAVDRTSTTMQTWMGLTAGCAVCHDHKYDPVTTKDFYSMYSFFYSASDPGMDGNIRDTSPFIKVPTPQQAAELETAKTRRADAEKRLDDAVAKAEPAVDWSVTGSSETRAIDDSILDDRFPLGTRTRNTSRNAAVWLLDPVPAPKSGRRVLELAYGSRYDLTVELTLIPVVIPEQGKLTLWVRVDPFHPPKSFIVQFDDGASRRAIWSDNAEEDRKAAGYMGPVPARDQWVQLEVPFEKFKANAGARIKSIMLIQDGGKIWVDDLRIVGQQASGTDPRTSFNEWWKISKGANPDGIGGDLKGLLTGGPKDDAPKDKLADLHRFWMKNVQRSKDSSSADLRLAFESAAQDVITLEDSIPGTFIFTELDKPRESFVMLRGQYDKPGEKVEPAVPSDFPPLRDETGAVLAGQRRANRLDLARWFVSEENPLTARVTVNRLWQQVFGTGLVKTSDDFGTRGDLPSHPELLDWLALEFRRSGWDQKALYRLLLTSAVFRQDSAASSHVLQIDPENRLLSHGPRFRLDAEQLRDNVLYVSGLMDLTMGGRGVQPYQPPDIWEPVGYENSNTRFYLQDHGAGLYRRSVYCFMKRTAPPPFMTNFDGPNREQFCTRRERSNTPLQALQLMNDVQHFEAARKLAERVMKEGGASDADRVQFLFRTVLSRLPGRVDEEIVLEALQNQRQHFLAAPENAEKVLQNGESKADTSLPVQELAAWAMTCNLVLNMDETVSRN